MDRERVRWYLEDFLEYPVDPAPAIAAGVEAAAGRDRARAVRRGCSLDEEARGCGRGVQGVLAAGAGRGRREVDPAATALPWELLRDPRTDRPLVLEAAAFVRVNSPARPAAAAARRRTTPSGCGCCW